MVYRKQYIKCGILKIISSSYFIMNQPDIIEISSSEQNKEIDISTPSVNFGGGIELLMNEKKKMALKVLQVILILVI